MGKVVEAWAVGWAAEAVGAQHCVACRFKSPRVPVGYPPSGKVVEQITSIGLLRAVPAARPRVWAERGWQRGRPCLPVWYERSPPHLLPADSAYAATCSRAIRGAPGSFHLLTPYCFPIAPPVRHRSTRRCARVVAWLEALADDTLKRQGGAPFAPEEGLWNETRTEMRAGTGGCTAACGRWGQRGVTAEWKWAGSAESHSVPLRLYGTSKRGPCVAVRSCVLCDRGSS